MKKIALGADHGGYKYKEKLVVLLGDLGYHVTDFGTYSEESVDYSDYACPLAKAVSAGEYDCGIVICGTGIGVSIVANKTDGIRCALVNTTEVAKITREHNDSNILAMGARVIDWETCRAITLIWLETEFSNEPRHQQRIDKIKGCENAG